jgi:hypothetical protein
MLFEHKKSDNIYIQIFLHFMHLKNTIKIFDNKILLSIHHHFLKKKIKCSNQSPVKTKILLEKKKETKIFVHRL